MLKITKDGKKIAVLKDDASEPEMTIEEQKKLSKKHLEQPEEDKEKANDDME